MRRPGLFFILAAEFFLFVCFVTIGMCPADAPTTAPHSNPFAALHWYRGPILVDIGSHASLQVPKGYAFLAPADAKKFLELNENPVGSTHHYILVPDRSNWFVDFSFDPIGYVKDHEKIDAAAVLRTVRENDAVANQERAKRGWASLKVIGWKFPPRYDTQTRRLEWAILATSGNQEVVNYNTRILGRRGVTRALLVADPRNLSSDVVKLNAILDNFQYNPDERYSAYRPGDKIAEYGLAALITGGAAAVAFKTGLVAIILAKLAACWKLIVVGAAAAFGYIGRLFRRFRKPKS